MCVANHVPLNPFNSTLEAFVVGAVVLVVDDRKKLHINYLRVEFFQEGDLAR